MVSYFHNLIHQEHFKTRDNHQLLIDHVPIMQLAALVDVVFGSVPQF